MYQEKINEINKKFLCSGNKRDLARHRRENRHSKLSRRTSSARGTLPTAGGAAAAEEEDQRIFRQAFGKSLCFFLLLWSDLWSDAAKSFFTGSVAQSEELEGPP